MWPAILTWIRTAARHVRLEMALVQAAGVAASLLILAADGGSAVVDRVWLWVVILLGLGLLRVLTAGASLASSTLVLEPIATVLFLSGTGGPGSPFMPVALGGIWWAVRSSRASPSRAYRIIRRRGRIRLRRTEDVEIGWRRPTAVIYGISLAVAYTLLIIPPAIRDGTTGEAVKDAFTLSAVWLVSELLVRARRDRARRVERDGPTSTPLQAPVSMNPKVAGLTSVDGRLLACLALGMTNHQIAQTIQVTSGSVRYRLSRLYRKLGVSTRTEAVDRALQLQGVIPIDRRGSAS
jgi:DNA-binding CsgD family transcriptional regulator